MKTPRHFPCLTRRGRRLHLTTPAIGADWRLWSLCNKPVQLSAVVPSGTSLCEHCIRVAGKAVAGAG